MGYSYDIDYCSTKVFGQADGLSRLPVGSDREFDQADPGDARLIALLQEQHQRELPLRAKDIAMATRKDPILSHVSRYVLTRWPTDHPVSLTPYFKIRHELSISHGCLLWNFRTLIPSCFREHLLRQLHSNHLGMSRMKSEARRYLWWPSLDQ